jgi:hypothetical protein
MTSQDQSILKAILNDPKWKVVILAMDEYVKKIQGHPTIDDNSEWKTTVNLLTREGQVRGLIQFMQFLNQEAQ